MTPTDHFRTYKAAATMEKIWEAFKKIAKVIANIAPKLMSAYQGQGSFIVKVPFLDHTSFGGTDKVRQETTRALQSNAKNIRPRVRIEHPLSRCQRLTSC